MDIETDPEDYSIALAEIERHFPDKQPIEEAQKDELVARALRLVATGTSITGAARIVGMRFAALYAKQKERDLEIASSGLSKADHELAENQAAIALAASEQVFERVEQGLMKDDALIRAMNNATNNLIALKQAPKSKAESGVSALAALLEEANVTITKRDPAQDAIEVEASTHDDQ